MNSKQRRKRKRFSERMRAAHKARLQDPGLASWLDERPWIDVTGDGEIPPYMLLEKTPPQNGHDIGKVVLNRFFKSLDSGKASLEG